MTMSRILCLQLAIKEMTSPLIVPQFLPTHRASTIQKIRNLSLYQTYFQFHYRLVQLTAITDGFLEPPPDNLHLPNLPSNAADLGARLPHNGTCKSSDLAPSSLYDLWFLTDPPELGRVLLAINRFREVSAESECEGNHLTGIANSDYSRVEQMEKEEEDVAGRGRDNDHSARGDCTRGAIEYKRNAPEPQLPAPFPPEHPTLLLTACKKHLRI